MIAKVIKRKLSWTNEELPTERQCNVMKMGNGKYCKQKPKGTTNKSNSNSNRNNKNFNPHNMLARNVVFQLLILWGEKYCWGKNYEINCLLRAAREEACDGFRSYAT